MKEHETLLKEIEKFQEMLKSKSDKEVIEMYQNIKSYEEEIKDLIVEEFSNRNLKIEEKIEKEIEKEKEKENYKQKQNI